MAEVQTVKLSLSISTLTPLMSSTGFVPSVGDLSKRNNNEDTLEKVPLIKKTVVILKKELAQKTEALNKALKRENELKVRTVHTAADSNP